MTKKYKLPQSAVLQKVRLSYRKFLIKIGINPDKKNHKFQVSTPWYERGVKKSAPLAHSVEQLICNQQVVCSNRTRGTTESETQPGTKPVNNWRLKESKKFTIAPAYNKGAYQVITPSNIKDIGR